MRAAAAVTAPVATTELCSLPAESDDPIFTLIAEHREAMRAERLVATKTTSTTRQRIFLAMELLSCNEVLRDAKQLGEEDPLMRSAQPVASRAQSTYRRPQMNLDARWRPSIKSKDASVAPRDISLFPGHRGGH